MDRDDSHIVHINSVFPRRQEYEELMRISANPSGYKREDAVRRLGVLGNALAIPTLIERANDWVPEVRRAAHEAILKLCTTENVSAFIEALPTLHHLEKCSRADHRGLMSQVHDFLASPKNRGALIKRMSDQNPHVAKMVCMLVLERKMLGTVELIDKCLRHNDVLVRSMAADNLRSLDEAAFESVLATVLRDNYMPVRREAFQQLLLRNRPRGLEQARKFLFDRNASIREIAAVQLSREGEKVEDIYYAAKNTGRIRILGCVIWAWAHFNCTSRVDDLQQYLSHPSPTIRRGSLQALTKLQGAELGPQLIAALSDTASSVSKEAARLINRNAIEISGKELIAISVASKADHVFFACCGIACKGNKWRWLQVVLGLWAQETQSEKQDHLRTQLRDWDDAYNRNPSQPTPDQLETIVADLKVCAKQINRERFELLRFTLRGYGVLL